MNDEFEIDDGTNPARDGSKFPRAGAWIKCVKCGGWIMWHDTPAERWLFGKLKCHTCLRDESQAAELYTAEEKARKLMTFNALFGENDLTWQQMIDANRRVP